jgi:lambda family phage portal protein
VNLIDRAIAAINPRAGLRRVRARAALEAMAHYRAASVRQRSPAIRAAAGDADAVAGGARGQIALSVRDLVRNNPTAAHAVDVLVNAIVGTGIEPKLVTDDQGLRDAWPEVQRRLDSTAIDGDGVLTLAAIQRAAVRAMIVDGDSLVVRVGDRPGDFQVRVLESDYLDERLNGLARNPANALHEGIEYGPDGRAVAYHLYDEHPGSPIWSPTRPRMTSTRYEADQVIHLCRRDRPGQRRGVSWLAPVIDDLVALADNDEAQLMRQKIAACFAAFWRSDRDPSAAGVPPTLAPGLIQQIGSDDEVTFGNPPDVTGYDDFARVHLRRIAAGLGMTYESLTGDLTGVNFSSARVGRIEMGQNVEAWQWTLVMPGLCAPLGRWLLRDWAMAEPDRITPLHRARIAWTPPPPLIADPKLEVQAATMRIDAGLSSRPAEIRKLGYEPAEIDAEITADMVMRERLARLKAPARLDDAPAPTEREERTLDA